MCKTEMRKLIAFGRVKSLGVTALAIGMVAFQAKAEDAENHSNSQEGYECFAPPQAAEPVTHMQWLERGLWASHCYAFQARAVAIDSVGVRTLALSHRIEDGIRQQVVQYLDGPSVSIERRSPVGSLAWTEDNNIDGDLPSPAKWAAHLEKFYTIELEENARVAGRDAVKLDFEPHDQWRFAHEWWLDRDTGLLLKQVLNDRHGQVIETFQITQLQSPEKYTGSLRAYPPNVVLNTSWRATWLPDGFVAQPITFSGDEVEQRVYSDGLATVSVFVEPLSSESAADLQEGVQQLGVSAVAIEHYVTDQGRWQLVAIGELPVETLQRIVSLITFDEHDIEDADQSVSGNDQ
ncbi:MAG: nucleoside transporter [Halomonas sp.]|nr:MAG: nucleoside transporter [Halomonas sp.]